MFNIFDTEEDILNNQ